MGILVDNEVRSSIGGAIRSRTSLGIRDPMVMPCGGGTALRGGGGEVSGIVLGRHGFGRRGRGLGGGNVPRGAGIEPAIRIAGLGLGRRHGVATKMVTVIAVIAISPRVSAMVVDQERLRGRMTISAPRDRDGIRQASLAISSVMEVDVPALSREVVEEGGQRHITVRGSVHETAS